MGVTGATADEAVKAVKAVKAVRVKPMPPPRAHAADGTRRGARAASAPGRAAMAARAAVAVAGETLAAEPAGIRARSNAQGIPSLTSMPSKTGTRSRSDPAGWAESAAATPLIALRAAMRCAS